MYCNSLLPSLRQGSNREPPALLEQVEVDLRPTPFTTLQIYNRRFDSFGPSLLAPPGAGAACIPALVKGLVQHTSSMSVFVFCLGNFSSNPPPPPSPSPPKSLPRGNCLYLLLNLPRPRRKERPLISTQKWW